MKWQLVFAVVCNLYYKVTELLDSPAHQIMMKHPRPTFNKFHVLNSVHNDIVLSWESKKILLREFIGYCWRHFLFSR